MLVRTAQARFYSWQQAESSHPQLKKESMELSQKIPGQPISGDRNLFEGALVKNIGFQVACNMGENGV